MKIADKYASTDLEKHEQISVSAHADAETAFENHCTELIVKAYYHALKEGILQVSWKETTISRHLKKHLKKCIKEVGVHYFVVPEYPEDDDNIDDGLKDSREEVYFDLVLSSFSTSDLHYFGVEAKIMIENDYLKRRASAEIAEYISMKGMRKFIEGIYKKRGCMLGYVVEGNSDAIIDKINTKIKADSFYTETEILEKRAVMNDFEHYYESIHVKYTKNPLRHLFLNFVLKN